MTPTRLTEIRTRFGMSQGRFAALIGVPRTTLNRYEAGTRDIPPPVGRLIDVMDIIRGVRERLEQIASETP